MLVFALITISISFTFFFLFILRFFIQRTHNLEERNKRLSVLRKVDEVMIASSTDFKEVSQKVTDAIAFELGFNNGVLALIDESRGVLRRVAMSNTAQGIKAKNSLPMPYDQLEIPLSADQNLSIQAIKTNQRKITHDLHDLFVPVIDKQMSKRIQETVGVTTSLVYPIKARGKVIGVMIVSIDKSESKLFSYETESIEELFDVVGITLDNATLYSRLKQTTADLQVANNKLRELDRLKDEFVSLASHELRTPLTAISSYLYMVIYKSMDKLPDRTGRYLTRAYLSTERLIGLVNDMLNVSRIESGRIEIKPSNFDIAKLVKEVVDEVKPKAQENQVQLFVLDNKPPQVFADIDKIHQVLLNLIGNSLKFTHPGGAVTVSFFTDGKMVDVSIKDNGVGISKEEQGKLFQKFSRLDSSYLAMGTNGGTGLGLFISKRLVELMSGRLWVNSEGVNKGSVFTFSLMIATQEVLNKSANLTIKARDGEAKGLEPVAL